MKLNESGLHKLYTQRSLASRRSMESYILTYSKLIKREPLIALGSHQNGGRGRVISASRSTSSRVGKTKRERKYRLGTITCSSSACKRSGCDQDSDWTYADTSPSPPPPTSIPPPLHNPPSFPDSDLGEGTAGEMPRGQIGDETSNVLLNSFFFFFFPRGQGNRRSKTILANTFQQDGVRMA